MTVFPHGITRSACVRRWHKQICFRDGNCVLQQAEKVIPKLKSSVEEFGACLKLPKQQRPGKP